MTTYRVAPPVNNQELNALFAIAWPHHQWYDFTPVLSRSLSFVCAYEANQLVGFVNLAWDGGIHTFILDTTVHPDVRRQGIGLNLVKQAVAVAQEAGIKWVHVDYEPHLETFYRQCGFRHSAAGVMALR
ncbi:MAG: GNAT family N-acetyltransferase [Anaerolineae bacterium]|nr:GNAT family N-acetyltransferase [Anaerolineae bacterium]